MAHISPEMALSSILKDNRSGSTDLALKVLEFYSVSHDRSSEFMKKSREAISNAHVGLGLVRNVNEILYGKWVSNASEIHIQCESLKMEITDQAELSVKNSLALIEDGSIIATLSNSSAVRRSLILARKELSRVYVLESRPGLEGREMAAKLEENGIDAVLIADAAVQEAAKNSDIALCGSDSVLSDRSLVHKIGTYPLFMAMRRAGKKTYSMTMGLKSENSFDSSTYPSFAIHDPGELVLSGQKALNIYFDITPATLISGYISEKGLLTLDPY